MGPLVLDIGFGPMTWTAENWMGAGITVGAFLVALWLAHRLARAGADDDQGGERP